VRLTSVHGTFRTCHDFQVEAAFGSKAEVGALSLHEWLLLARSGCSLSRVSHSLILVVYSAEALDMNPSSGPTGMMPLGFNLRWL
jgi:hypothetical protein